MSEITIDPAQCACPVIAAGARRVNDSWVWSSDAERTAALQPLALAQPGSRSTPAVEARRRALAVDFAVKRAAPAWLRRAGQEVLAARLEALPAYAPATRDTIVAECRAVRNAAAVDAIVACRQEFDIAHASLLADEEAAEADLDAAYAAGTYAAAAYAADAPFAAAYAPFAAAHAAADAAYGVDAARPLALALTREYIGVLLAMCAVTEENERFA